MEPAKDQEIIQLEIDWGPRLHSSGYILDIRGIIRLKVTRVEHRLDLRLGHAHRFCNFPSLQ